MFIFAAHPAPQSKESTPCTESQSSHLAKRLFQQPARDANIASLGVTLRRMAQHLMSDVVEPKGAEIDAAYCEMRSSLATAIERELSQFQTEINVTPSQTNASRRGWFRSLSAKQLSKPCHEDIVCDVERRFLEKLRARARSSDAQIQAVAARALSVVAGAVQSRHGRIIGVNTFLAPLAIDLACNEHGGEVIGRLIEPWLHDSARRAGYRRLPTELRPVAMVTKGASAAGKSTMRPLQRQLAAKMGLQWSDFALVSPDTWRRILLDFDSLGRFCKYAGMLTSHELQVVDQKLDAYLVRKGEERRVSHLLVDRFRFDSFALDSPENRFSPSRFGNLLCYFFMITPPEEIVERAWKRGLEIGRYKAVDDLLSHNVEAFTGMQSILFGRALDPKANVHFEFLDNEVPRGERPKTAAFGWSGELNIIDIGRMLDIERFRHISLTARGPTELYVKEPKAASFAKFLATSIARFRRLNLADRRTGRVYAHFDAGKLQWFAPKAMANANLDERSRQALRHVAPQLFDGSAPPETEPLYLRPERYHTIGSWIEGDRGSKVAEH